VKLLRQIFGKQPYFNLIITAKFDLQLDLTQVGIKKIFVGAHQNFWPTQQTKKLTQFQKQPKSKVAVTQ
jgi:hypothetical protein